MSAAHDTLPPPPAPKTLPCPPPAFGVCPDCRGARSVHLRSLSRWGADDPVSRRVTCERCGGTGVA